MTPEQEKHLLLRVQKRVETPSKAGGLWRHELLVWILLASLCFGSIKLLGWPNSSTIWAAVVAFLAGLLSMLYLVKRIAAMQWLALAPHVDRESLKARLRTLEG